MGAREAGGSRFCAVVRCVSCVLSSDMLAEPPNTDRRHASLVSHWQGTARCREWPAFTLEQE